jgi:ketosteroid isomerase-like protein
MADTATAEEFAEHLRAAYAAGMEEGLAAAAPFVADVVELAHEPPHPADGMKPGAELAGLWTQEGSMLLSTMPDARITDLVIAAKGDDVELRAVLRGTSPDGAELAHSYTVLYSLRSGKLVRACATYDPAPVAALNENAFRGAAPA